MENRYTRGSNWRKWDLHIHTKGTAKNDQFTSTDFDTFCIILFKKALENKISAIGITDYFSVKNYKKIRNYVSKIDNNEKFSDEEKALIKQILILPNVELRMLPVTDKEKLVNIHCIFNPSFVDFLENDFFVIRHDTEFQSQSAGWIIRPILVWMFVQVLTYQLFCARNYVARYR